MVTPTGQRFSLTYLERGLPSNDSPRVRRRLTEKLSALIGERKEESAFGEVVVSETGAEIGRDAYAHYRVVMWVPNAPLRDLLDVVTLFYRWLSDKRRAEEFVMKRFGRAPLATHNPQDWLEFFARFFKEENVGYRVDEKCGVHFHVDAEFEHSRIATLAVLEHPLLGNARSSFEDAFRHLDSDPRDTKAAVRSMFEAAEVITKQLCPEAQNLNRRLVEGKLKERLHESRRGDATENKVFDLMFDGFGDWVDALHNYRHGQKADEPVTPGEELTVLALSTGASYVRLLGSCLLRLEAA